MTKSQSHNNSGLQQLVGFGLLCGRQHRDIIELFNIPSVVRGTSSACRFPIGLGSEQHPASLPLWQGRPQHIPVLSDVRPIAHHLGFAHAEAAPSPESTLVQKASSHQVGSDDFLASTNRSRQLPDRFRQSSRALPMRFACHVLQIHCFAALAKGANLPKPSRTPCSAAVADNSGVRGPSVLP